MSMSDTEQKGRAETFRRLHHAPSSMLVLPNAWDVASARILERAGFLAIATTSSGVAAALGYSDGQRIGRELLIEATARITGAVGCPVSVDIEAGYGSSIDEVRETVWQVIETGAVGINIEDSRPENPDELVDLTYQMELIASVRELAASLDIPLVINARTDAFLLQIGQPEDRVQLALERSHAYAKAGADCIYPISGSLTRPVIAELVKSAGAPINILVGGAATPTLAELAGMGVARVSFGGGLMRSVLGHLQEVAREVLDRGSLDILARSALPGSEFESLFETRQ
jgi:2-methylisocitrate lyase-like PEP mutase family enzyme